MEDMTYGYANEGWSLPTLVQFVWIKHLRHIKYADAYDRSLKQTTGNSKQWKSHLTKQLICRPTWISVINRKFRYA